MQARIIVTTSGQRGVGKTTSIANIAAALAMFGKKVVVIDTDAGPHSLGVVMGLESRVTFDIIDVIYKRCHLNQALVMDKRLPNLFLLPGAKPYTKDAVNRIHIQKDTVLISALPSPKDNVDLIVQMVYLCEEL